MVGWVPLGCPGGEVWLELAAANSTELSST